MIYKKGKANFYFSPSGQDETMSHGMVCFLMDSLTKKCRQTEPEEAWSEDFTCPLPAMDLSQGKREIIKMMMPMSMAGLTLSEE